MIVWVRFSVLVLAALAARSACSAADTMQLAALPLVRPQTGLAVTEDGKHLVISHESENLLTVWDVATGKVERTIACPSPRFILCRGDRAYIASHGNGKIEVLNAVDWSVENEVLVGQPEVDYLSAPMGKAFKDEIIAACHINHAETNDYLVDVKRDSHSKVSTEYLCTVSSDGRFVHGQQNFDASPRCNWVKTYAQFEKGEPKNLCEGWSVTSVLYQVRPGAWWFGATDVYHIGGTSYDHTAEKLGRGVVPDMMQDAYYVFGDNEVECFRVSATIDRFGAVPVKYPEAGAPDKSKRGRREEAPNPFGDHFWRDGRYDTPVAVTLGDRTTFFIPEGTRVWSCSMAAVKVQAGPAPTGGVAAESPGNLGSLPSAIVVGVPMKSKLKFPVGTKVRLVNPPTHMTLSDDGELAWTPTSADLGEHVVKFRLETAGVVSFERYTVNVLANEGDKPAVSVGTAGKGIALDGGEYTISFPQRPGTGIAILQDGKLRLTDTSGKTELSPIALPREYKRLAERDSYYVGLTDNALDLIDKKSLKVFKTIELGVPKTFELAIQPGVRRSFVTVYDDDGGREPEQLACRLYDVNEATGETRKVPGVAGQWVVADPNRRRVFVGLHFIYEAGIILDFNVGDIRPDYGNVDVLEDVDFDAAQGQVVVKTNIKAGANGRCVRIAPDGKAVAFVSAVGTPAFSSNIPAFDPNDPCKVLASYSMKDLGFAVDVAFHPSLPIAAGITDQKVRLFDRATGEVLKDKVDFGGLVPKDLRRCLFSPDGKFLLLDTTTQAGRLLVALPLRLTGTEVSRLHALPAPPTERDVPLGQTGKSNPNIHRL